MSAWFEPFTRLTSPSDDVMWSRCRVHDPGFTHETVEVPVKILWPMWQMLVYDWMQYGGEELDWWQEYCPGQDVVSRSIALHGIWEPHETALFIDILRQGTGEGAVLDFGCQLGWYAALANRLGYNVAAVDVNAENVKLARLNAVDAEVSLGAIDEHAPLFDPEVNVRVAKIDIEGAERWAVRMLAPVLEARNVHYLLMEVSPVFNDSYPDIVREVMSYGYNLFLVPSSDMPRFYDQPLNTVLTECQMSPAVIPYIHQADVLFRRRP